MISGKNMSANEDSAIDYSNIPNDKMQKAKILFKTIRNVLGKSLRSPITGKSSFYFLGGNSLNSVVTVTKLQNLGFSISNSQHL